uniref:Uncharacterized protein n=1 Tax=viral metagenome TaxID=1070528 RepID=A0A6M3IS39_9ZZZZ
MKTKKQKLYRFTIIGFLGIALLLGGFSIGNVLAQNFQKVFYISGNYVEAPGVAGNGELSFGGSTGGDWNVAGNLTIAGTSAFTGAVTTSGGVTLSGTNSFTGTTTVTKSYDGFIIQPTPTYATGSVSMLYTNGTGKTIMCNVGAFMANSLNANLGRNFKVSLGTSTAVTGAGINLLSTTTVATTSDTVLTMTYTKPFMLANNESIIGYFADVDANASSTYFSSTYWELRAEIPCTLMGG